MKILFVLNQLPYPPRNGVTIPTYNYIKGLSETNDVSLLFLRDPGHESSDEGIARNRELVRDLWVTDVRKLPRAERIFREIKGDYFFHIGRHYDSEYIKNIFKNNEFDAIWISDDGILDIVEQMRECSGSRAVIVAGINDCITAVFKQSITQVFLKGGTPGEKLVLFIKWLRSFRAGAIEDSILSRFDKVLVQSDSDRDYLSNISGTALDSKIVVLSNGVESRLFISSNKLDSKSLVFVGSLRGYSRIVEFLLEDVWPSVKRAHPEAVFHVIGRGASDVLRAKMSCQQGIVHIEFVADITDVYEGKAVSISPVFKSYGLINKVIESMAAGVPVVADKGGFGCIPNFENGKHGLVANNAKAMIEAIDALLCSGEKRMEIAANARVLVKKHFAWKDRVNKIHRELQNAST